VQAMKAAGKELKAAFKQPELNINSIENLQDDLADMMVSCAKYFCISATLMNVCRMTSSKPKIKLYA